MTILSNSVTLADSIQSDCVDRAQLAMIGPVQIVVVAVDCLLDLSSHQTGRRR